MTAINPVEWTEKRSALETISQDGDRVIDEMQLEMQMLLEKLQEDVVAGFTDADRNFDQTISVEPTGVAAEVGLPAQPLVAQSRNDEEEQAAIEEYSHASTESVDAGLPSFKNVALAIDGAARALWTDAQESAALATVLPLIRFESLSVENGLADDANRSPDAGAPCQATSAELVVGPADTPSQSGPQDAGGHVIDRKYEVMLVPENRKLPDSAPMPQATSGRIDRTPGASQTRNTISKEPMGSMAPTEAILVGISEVASHSDVKSGLENPNSDMLSKAKEVFFRRLTDIADRQQSFEVEPGSAKSSGSSEVDAQTVVFSPDKLKAQPSGDEEGVWEPSVPEPPWPGGDSSVDISNWAVYPASDNCEVTLAVQKMARSGNFSATPVGLPEPNLLGAHNSAVSGSVLSGDQIEQEKIVESEIEIGAAYCPIPANVELENDTSVVGENASSNRVEQKSYSLEILPTDLVATATASTDRSKVHVALSAPTFESAIGPVEPHARAEKQSEISQDSNDDYSTAIMTTEIQIDFIASRSVEVVGKLEVGVANQSAERCTNKRDMYQESPLPDGGSNDYNDGRGNCQRNGEIEPSSDKLSVQAVGEALAAQHHGNKPPENSNEEVQSVPNVEVPRDECVEEVAAEDTNGLTVFVAPTKRLVEYNPAAPARISVASSIDQPTKSATPVISDHVDGAMADRPTLIEAEVASGMSSGNQTSSHNLSIIEWENIPMSRRLELKWALRDIRAERSRRAPIVPADLQILEALGFVECRVCHPVITSSGLKIIM